MNQLTQIISWLPCLLFAVCVVACAWVIQKINSVSAKGYPLKGGPNEGAMSALDRLSPAAYEKRLSVVKSTTRFRRSPVCCCADKPDPQRVEGLSVWRGRTPQYGQTKASHKRWHEIVSFKLKPKPGNSDPETWWVSIATAIRLGRTTFAG